VTKAVRVIKVVVKRHKVLRIIRVIRVVVKRYYYGYLVCYKDYIGYLGFLGSRVIIRFIRVILGCY
jgi:hypothetical protein